MKAGQRFKINNIFLNTVDTNSADSILSNITVHLMKGSVNGGQVAGATISNPYSPDNWYYQGTSDFDGTKIPILNYTAPEEDDYYLVVEGTLSGLAPENNLGGNFEVNPAFPMVVSETINSEDIEITPVDSSSTSLDIKLSCETSLDAFGTLTYNGFGFNFGAGKVAYISDESMIFKMGTLAGLKISPNGMQRFVPDSYRYSKANILHRYTNSNQWIGLNDYVVRIVQELSGGFNVGSVDIVSPMDEMLIVKSITNAIILLLPDPSTCAGKSYIIKNRSGSDNLFVGSGALSTANVAGNIIGFNASTGYNDSCNITNSGGTTTYRGLMKCYKHSR